jgi:hypothetical protein
VAPVYLQVFLAPLDLAGLRLLPLNLLGANLGRVVFDLAHPPAIARVAVSERIDPVIKAHARSGDPLRIGCKRSWKVPNGEYA